MLKRHKNRQPTQPTAVEVLKNVPPTGEAVRLPNGAVFQKPNPDMIAALQAIDPRVRYFPTDLERASSVPSGYAYYRGVTDLLPAQIMRDFPGDRQRTAQRGTVVSLRDEFPHFDNILSRNWDKFPEVDVEYGDELQMNNVLTILKTGSDRGGIQGKLGAINEEGSLNTHTEDYLMFHTHGAIEKEVKRGETGRADNLFPALLVYETDKLAGSTEIATVDPDALVALYITDREFYDNPNVHSVDYIKGLGATAL